MSETMPIKETAVLWNLSERRVRSLCREGKIPGAVKISQAPLCTL